MRHRGGKTRYAYARTPVALLIRWLEACCLGSGEVFPAVAGKLHLIHSTLIRVKKIMTLRNSVGMHRLYRALGPLKGGRSAAVLLGLWDGLHPVLNAVLDTGRTSGY